MISNGYKVIGIEENGNVEYDVMSSCPVSECTLYNAALFERKKCTRLQIDWNEFPLFCYSIQRSHQVNQTPMVPNKNR